MPSWVFYWDKEKGKLVEGYPPPVAKVYGQAPIYLSDEMPATVHPATGQTITSRKAWKETDAACGTFTTSPKERTKARPSVTQAEIDADILQATEKAIAAVKNGTHSMPEDLRQMHRQADELRCKQEGTDFYLNPFGEKKRGRKRKAAK